jgi:hypothetical protein
MTAIRSEAIGYINDFPEEKLMGVIKFLRSVHATKHPLEITSKEELYRHLEEGMDDIKNGRSQPFEESMQDIRKELAQYGV